MTSPSRPAVLRALLGVSALALTTAGAAGLGAEILDDMLNGSETCLGAGTLTGRYRLG